MSNVKDVRVKAVPIELEGKTFHLKYDLNAFADLEDKYGTIRNALDSLGGKIEKDDEGKVIMVDELDEDANVVMDDEGKPKQVPSRKISVKGLRTIFWVGLLHESPDMTEREAGALLDISHMKYLAKKMGEAMRASMPEVEDKDKGTVAKKVETTIRESKNL